MTLRQVATLLLLALIWGSSFLFIKWGVLEMPVMAVVAGRLGMGLLFLLGVMIWQRRALPRRALWVPLLVVALVNNVVPWFLIVWGEQHISSGLASILNATTPLFSVLLASTWGDEQFTWFKSGGLVLGFVGTIVLIGADLRDFFVADNQVLLGELAILGAALCYAIGAVYARRTLRGEPAVQLATGQLLIASLIILPLMAIPANQPQQWPSLQALLGVAALGFFGSGLAYILFYTLLEEVGATRTVVVTYLLPLVALFLGWSVLGELITWRTLAGMGLILLGIGLVNGQLRYRRALEQPVGASR